MTVTIFHNPRCGTSRTTLQLIRDRGIEPVIVDYLKTPPSRAELARLAKVAGAGTLLRRKEPLAGELGLTGAGASDAAILDAIAAHPILLNRPVVVTEKGARACRPPELVYEIL